MTNSTPALLASILLCSTAPAVADSANSQNQNSEPTSINQFASSVAEQIPDDIWDTIASPFDPITTPAGFATQRSIEPLPVPRPSIQQPMQQPPAAVAPQPAPRRVVAPQPVAPRPLPAEAPQRYPLQARTPVPYELPPQEKVVAAEYPEEYWNCLLNNLQGVGSDVAAKLITRACQKKYPKQ